MGVRVNVRMSKIVRRSINVGVRGVRGVRDLLKPGGTPLPPDALKNEVPTLKSRALIQKIIPRKKFEKIGNSLILVFHS